MPLQDWTRVDAGIFHDFHVAWIPEIRKVLNGGLLPEGYYALAEQHAGRAIADLLTLHTSPANPEGVPARLPLPPATGGVALADAPPRARRRHTVEPAALGRRRSLAIRHVSGHRLVALIEIISPANKDRSRHVKDFVDKAASALDLGVHLLLVDLFPPGPHDPSGMHGAILQELESSEVPYEVPADEPSNAGELRCWAGGGHLRRARRRRRPPAGDAAVPPVGPLRQRAAGADLPGRL